VISIFRCVLMWVALVLIQIPFARAGRYKFPRQRASLQRAPKGGHSHPRPSNIR
jgi:hypothetical protein